MRTLRTFDERRRQIVLAVLRELLPRLHRIVQDELAYREAIGDLVPGALIADDVVDAIVLEAYRDLVTNPDDMFVIGRLRRLALGHIDREVARLRVNRERPIHVDPRVPKVPPRDVTILGEEILYFFEPDEDLEANDAVPDTLAPAPTPEQQLEGDELRQCLESALNAMPLTWRRALLLRHVDGLAGSAVARAIGRPEREIGALLDHARAYLREQLLSSRYPVPDPAPSSVEFPT